MPIDVPRHILAAVDLSELSAQALRYADALSRCSGGRVTALYASSYSPPPYFTESQLEQFAAQMRDSTAGAARSLASFVEQVLGPGSAPVETQVLDAPPVEAILRAAQDTGADLVAMGTHGRTGVNRWLLGSVAERVLRQSRIPVLTARGGLPADAPVRIRQILCPVNDSPVARASLQLATRLAACLDATVTVLHVTEPGATNSSIGDLCEWIARQDRSHCSIRELTREGDAAQAIITSATETGCDLLVMGARHRLFLDTTILGTTTIRTVRHSPCPVLTVMEWPD